jgi:hypothetical protein
VHDGKVLEEMGDKAKFSKVGSVLVHSLQSHSRSTDFQEFSQEMDVFRKP